MRAAVISLNKRIILKERNIRTLEAVNMRQWLLSTGKFDEVHFVSTKSARDTTEAVEYYKEAATTNLCDYPHVFVHNDTVNFMGGELSRHTVKQVKELCEHKGNVYYVYTDPNLHLQNLAKVIHDRQVRGTKTNFNTELRITADEVSRFAELKWKVIWCGTDFSTYWNKEYIKLKPELRCRVERSTTLEFFKFMFSHRVVDLPNLPLSERKVDLVYYGNWRPKRAARLTTYLGNNLNKRVVGFEEKKLALTNAEYLPYAEPSLLAGLVHEAVASIVIGDPAHNDNITTARFYENILFEVCSFIDLEYDSQRRLYKSQFLKDYMYINNGHQLCQKIEAIRRDEQLFKKIINEQKQELL